MMNYRDLTNEGLVHEYEQYESLLTKFTTKKSSLLVEIMIMGSDYLSFKKFFSFDAIDALSNDV